MPIYPIRCDECGAVTDTAGRPEGLQCPECGALAKIDWGRMTSRVSLDNGNKAYTGYNHGLGMHIDSKSQYKRVLRDRGLAEKDGLDI